MAYKKWQDMQRFIANMTKVPYVQLIVEDMTTLTTEDCNKLQPGMLVAKKTGNQYHVYMVSYKEEGVGMCLTYVDASRVETQSYDCTDNEWVYNSEDLVEFSNYYNKTEVENLIDASITTVLNTSI